MRKVILDAVKWQARDPYLVRIGDSCCFGDVKALLPS